MLRSPLVLIILGMSGAAAADDWKPVEGRIRTRWASGVTPDRVLPEYPRPTLVRDAWQNLNGLWDYAVTKAEGADAAAPPTAKYDGKILVPFPIESALSGVGRALGPDERLWYRRTFRIPAEWAGQRVRLHFGAVDWHARVLLNGKLLGEHKGGYDGFSFDATSALNGGDNELLVAVADPTDAGGQPRGKQWAEPHGIWYTRSSGIWQTVWLEPVPSEATIEAVEIVPDVSGARVRVDVKRTWRSRGIPPARIEIVADGAVVGRSEEAVTGPVEIALAAPRLWSPDDPFLYEVRVSFSDLGVTDRVRSYFGMREVKVAPDDQGVTRILLNGKPLFQFGPLDQGFWPDGLYTAPTDEALRFDVEAVRRMGGNLLRKHVKVEPERFYAWCDRLGVLVWQDIPSPFFAAEGWKEKLPALTEEWKAQFQAEMTAIMQSRRHHPSIVMWVPFNEGWGQNDLDWAKEMVALARKLDPSRLVNNASGWTDMGVGDVNDIHVYPGPGAPPNEKLRAAVLGEFGGLGLPVEGHTWVGKNNWGYVSYKSPAELTEAYVVLLRQLPLLIGEGLCAAVYTQTTDVEIECNGWLTYDREVWKIDPSRAAEAARALHGPPPRVAMVVPRAGQGEAARWRYALAAPAGDWFSPGFDDSGWETGVAGFGARGTPGALVGTPWSSGDIWLRREFELAAVPAGPHLAIHHDEDAEVFVNGELAATLRGYTTRYRYVPLSEGAARSLRVGRNTLAIHCRQTRGGQYIDAGLAEVK